VIFLNISSLSYVIIILAVQIQKFGICLMEIPGKMGFSMMEKLEKPGLASHNPKLAKRLNPKSDGQIDNLI
jgi:hypothetical protein